MSTPASLKSISLQDVSQRTNQAWKISGYTGCSLQICTILFVPLWIAMIVVGSIYLHSCALNANIPIWMIVYGAAALLDLAFNIMSVTWYCIVNRDKTFANRTHGNIFDVFSAVTGLFIFIWLIVGSVWIFAPYAEYNHAGRPNCSAVPGSPLCCERPLFLFAFVVAIFGWVSIGLVLVLFCIAACIGCCCAAAVFAGYSAV